HFENREDLRRDLHHKPAGSRVKRRNARHIAALQLGNKPVHVSRPSLMKSCRPASDQMYRRDIGWRKRCSQARSQSDLLAQSVTATLAFPAFRSATFFPAVCEGNN